MKRACCSDCVFFNPEAPGLSKGEGLCQRNPPQIVVLPMRREYSIGNLGDPAPSMIVPVPFFPKMNGTDWCGHCVTRDDGLFG